MRRGPWRLGALLGEGAMGAVYTAVHEESGREVALKTVSEVSHSVASGLRREIAALAQIRHPGVVTIVDDGVDSNGMPWYAMDLVPGVTLRRYLRLEGPFEPEATLVPSTGVPSTGVPSTGVPSTGVSSTGVPSTGVPSTGVPSTRVPSTLAPSTPVPSTAQSTVGATGWWTEATLPGRGSVDSLWDTAGSLVAHVPTRAGPTEPQRYDVDEGLEVLQRLAHALAYLHGEGIVHRDLKPENVIVRPDGIPVIVDFGLTARFADEGGRESLEARGSFAGTPSYMAPEQVLGKAVDARADLYSLGCMLYEILTGRPPFVAETTLQLLNQHLERAVVPPSRMVPGIDEVLDDLVLGLLAKRPADRPGHGLDVARVLSELTGQSGPPQGWPKPTPYLYRPEFRGRAVLLRDILEALDDAEEGRGTVIEVRAGAGLGKTRLLVEVCTEAKRREVPTIAGRARQATRLGARPLEALRPLLVAVADRCRSGQDPKLERLVTEQAGLLATYEPALAEATGRLMLRTPGESEHAMRKRLLDSLIEVLHVLTSQRPLLLALDDLQWADDLTLALLERLKAEVSRLPIVVVAARRDEAGTSESSDTAVTPGPLDDAAVAAMAADMLGLERAPDELVALLKKNAGGNPLFCVQYLHAALDAGLLARGHDGRWHLLEGSTDAVAHLAAPKGVLEVVANRLAGLSEEARTLVGIAASLGRPATSIELSVALDRPAHSVDAALRAACTRRLLDELPTGRFEVSDGPTREVAVSLLDSLVIRAAHGRVAHALSNRATDPAELLLVAEHFDHAGQPERAATALVRAARHWADRYVDAEAERLYEEALTRLPGGTLDSVLARAELVERVLLPAGRDREARTHARIALTVATSTAAPDVISRCRRLAEIATH